MNLLPPLVLGIVQGLTEFLPVSSSGHLIVIPKLFHWSGAIDSLGFDVALHLGTAVALIAFFWREWVSLTEAFLNKFFTDRKNLLRNHESKLFLLLLVGSIPAGFVGIAFKDFIETSFRSVLLVGVMMIVFGFILWYVDRKGRQDKKIDSISFVDSLMIGVGQALSLVPGVSRSGITITAARSRNIERESAVRFSFLLSTPAILGAGLVTAKDLTKGGLGNSSVFIIGFLAATISGWFAIKLLLYLSKRQNFDWFVKYRYVFGAFLILFALATHS